MKLNTAWLLYYGLKAGMSKAETMTSRPGEIFDLIACMAIENGARQKIQIPFDEAIKLR